MAEKVEELKIWQRSMDFWRAVNTILDRPGLLRDGRLRSQLSDATDSIVSNIVEGFAQSSDKGFARYLVTSKGSAAEARARLLLACERQYITRDEFTSMDEVGDEIARMLTGFIKYLHKSNRRDRGLGLQRSRQPRRRVSD